MALFGVVLAVCSGAERSHWHCQFGACAVAAVKDGASDHNDRSNHKSNAGACSHSHCCQHANAACQTAQAAVSQTSGETTPRSGCPCPPGCWCHQSPQPWDLPHGPSPSIELALTSQLSGHPGPAMATVVETKPSMELAAADCHLAETAPEFCAALCRFLI